MIFPILVDDKGGLERTSLIIYYCQFRFNLSSLCRQVYNITNNKHKTNIAMELTMKKSCGVLFHYLLPSDFVVQSVGQRWSKPKVVGSIPTLVRVFL